MSTRGSKISATEHGVSAVKHASTFSTKNFLSPDGQKVLLYCGDNIEKSSELVGPDKWYTEFDMAKKFSTSSRFTARTQKIPKAVVANWAKKFL